MEEEKKPVKKVPTQKEKLNKDLLSVQKKLNDKKSRISRRDLLRSQTAIQIAIKNIK